MKLEESEKKDKFLGIGKELKTTMEHESDGDTNCNWCARYSHQRFATRTTGLRNKNMSLDHPNYIIVEIGQNTEKSPGDSRRFANTQTPENNHEQTLLWKTLKRGK